MPEFHLRSGRTPIEHSMKLSFCPPVGTIITVHDDETDLDTVWHVVGHELEMFQYRSGGLVTGAIYLDVKVGPAP